MLLLFLLRDLYVDVTVAASFTGELKVPTAQPSWRFRD